jgi:hypothetical protein
VAAGTPTDTASSAQSFLETITHEKKSDLVREMDEEWAKRCLVRLTLPAGTMATKEKEDALRKRLEEFGPVISLDWPDLAKREVVQVRYQLTADAEKSLAEFKTWEGQPVETADGIPYVRAIWSR